MKKDIEWLKEEVQKRIDKLPSTYSGPYTEGSRDAYHLALQDIDQLDEPEVLSQEWIDEYKAYAREYNIGHYIQVEHLQNLLIPKQEELETKIKVLIEAYKQEEDAYSNPENGWISGFIEDLKNLVEEEQKDYVSERDEECGGFWFLSKNNNGNISIGVNRDWSEVDWDRLKLTEQEIKDYDERYWAFAKPVEELEE